MKNLNGCLKKILSIFSLILTFLLSYSFLFSNQISAQQAFRVYSDFFHVWDGQQELSTTIYLTITTESTPRVITYYTVTIPEENIRPEVYSIDKNIKLDPTYYDRQSATDLVIDLKNTVVSKDKPITLKLTYQSEISKNNISLTSSVKDTEQRAFSFSYPQEKGDVTWSSTPINKVNIKGKNIEILTAPPTTDRVNISLGVPVQYSFQISRNLINSSDEIISSEVTVPPNTNNQILILEKVQPKPDRSYKDINGNYILQYHIAPQSNIDVLIEGYLKMEKTLFQRIDNLVLESKNLWELRDSALKKRINRYLNENSLNISQDFSNISELENEEEKEFLYYLLYKFVIDNLEPNTLTIGSLAGSARLGGERALTEQANSTSEDYTDSIVTLYRYYGIPARLVIGYVTNISDYHPDGMYHYWAEYYDSNKKDWIVVDPFLEDYSGNSLWSREMPDHISLIYRYDNPNTPKLPYYTENDFKISITRESPDIVYNFDAYFILRPYKIVDSHLQGSMFIKNTGNTILDMFEISKSKPDFNLYLDYIENNTSTILLPNDKHEILFNIPSKEIENEIYAVLQAFSGTQSTDEKYIESSIDLVESNYPLRMFSKLISILVYFILAIPLYFISLRISKK